jgi:pyruvate decarboxylase
MVSEPVDAKRLEKPLNLTPPKDDEVEEELVKKILDALYAAKNPMILVDILTARFQCTPEVRQLIEITQLPVFLDLARC